MNEKQDALAVRADAIMREFGQVHDIPLQVAIEVGRVRLRLTQPIFCDPYTRNRTTGGLILIDEATNATVGAAMITDAR